MHHVKVWAQCSSIRRLLVGGLVFLAALQWGLTANAQKAIPTTDPPSNPSHSDYSLDSKTTTLEIDYKVVDDKVDSGVVKSPGTININWTTSSGAPPAPAIVVEIKFSYQNSTGKYRLAKVVPRTKGTYSFDLSKTLPDLPTAMIPRLNAGLPRHIDPRMAIVMDGPVAVTVTPYLAKVTDPTMPPDAPADGDAYLGNPIRTTNDLTITLKPTP